MATVEFSEFAKQDLENIAVYLAEQNLNHAQKLLSELRRKFSLLSENPKLGKLKDKYIIDIRSFSHKHYVIFYFPTENGIEIYRVIHDARDIDDLFESQFEGLKP